MLLAVRREGNAPPVSLLRRRIRRNGLAAREKLPELRCNPQARSPNALENAQHPRGMALCPPSVALDLPQTRLDLRQIRLNPQLISSESAPDQASSATHRA
jgi:hypothetical protein